VHTGKYYLDGLVRERYIDILFYRHQ
jgi:hypothetical protein